MEYQVVVRGRVIAYRDSVWDAMDFARQHSIETEFYVQVYSPYTFICSYANGRSL